MPRKKGLTTGRKGLGRSPNPKLTDREELARLRGLVKAYEEEIEDLKTQNEEMKLFKTKYEDLVKERLDQFEKIEDLKSQSQTLKLNLVKWKTQNEDLYSKIEVLKTQLKSEKAPAESLPPNKPNYRHFFYELSKYEALVSKVLTLF